MNILVAAAVPIAGTSRSIPDWRLAEELGHNVRFLNETSLPPDAIVSMSISQMEATFELVKRYPSVPLFCYQWDAYAWVWNRPRKGEYDYSRFGQMLQRAREIWVPSHCTGLRTLEWWNLHNWEVVLSSAPYWDWRDVEDRGYLLCTLREIPDPWCNHFERACQELSIPYLRTNHLLSFEEYKKAVAGCRGLVSHYFEASTGGLTLLEGYYLGKPCLLSDSEWMGGSDYLGDRASYFRWGDYDDFKAKLKDFWDNPPQLPDDHAAWVAEHFSDARMVRDMVNRIETRLSREAA